MVYLGSRICYCHLFVPIPEDLYSVVASMDPCFVSGIKVP